MKRIGIIILLIFLTACAQETAVPLQPTAFAATAPGAAALLATPITLPTAAAINQVVIYNGLSIKVVSAELNDSYTTEYGTTRDAPTGVRFLWVQLSLESVDYKGIKFPDADHFSTLYAAEEYKSTYGHREGCPDYTSLTGLLFPGSPSQAWLRFDLPESAGLAEIQFAFLPESTEITTSRTPSESSYYDHPVYVWRLTDQ